MILQICFVFAVLFYIFTRLTRGITRSGTCLVGKTAIITGANSGIGYETALNLASRGCKVIIADVADLEESRSNIIRFSNNNDIIAKKLDLSSFKSVRDFACDILKNEATLHILINNAGISTSNDNRTGNGLHPVMQVNYFGHFLLTHLLIGLLKKSAPSRIVSTSSFMSFINNLTLENLNYDATINNVYTRGRIYSNSKFALLIMSDIFADKLKGTGVTSNSINPGLTKTSMLQKFHSLSKTAALLKKICDLLEWLYAKNAWEGSQVLVHVAVSKKLEQVTGKYFSDCRPFFKPWGGYNRQFCNEIWEASEKYVNLAPEEKL